MVASLSNWLSKPQHINKPKHILSQLAIAYQRAAVKKDEQVASMFIRHQFSFYGIRYPERRKLEKEFHEQILTKEECFALIASCWKEKMRDFQYFGQESFLKRLDVMTSGDNIEDTIELLKAIMVEKSWWDTIDMLSPKILGSLAKSHPDYVLPVIDEWIRSDHMWLRRSALLYQLSYKKSTDKDKLFRYCTLCCHEKEFFIQKAIGWSLREYAKTNAKAVSSFVKKNEKKLAKLSVKEALKHIKK